MEFVQLLIIYVKKDINIKKGKRFGHKWGPSSVPDKFKYTLEY